MRTTIEITSDQHEALTSLAKRRGLRGFSPIVQEAISSYLTDLETSEIDFLLGLEGVLTASDEEEMRSRIAKAKAEWRAS